MAKYTIERAITAVKDRDSKLLSSMLAEGFDPDQYDKGGWTPLLVAAARGYDDIVDLLLNNENSPANPDIPHNISKGLPIHFAGHSGNTKVADLILEKRPEHMEEIWDINGHTLLLQAAFYGHLDLAEYALKKGANTAATTVRGLSAMEFAKQFQNEPLQKIIEPYDKPKEEKEEYYKMLLERIAPVIPEDEREEQDLADEMNSLLSTGLANAADNPAVIDSTIDQISDFIENKGVDVNRLAGPLSQPPLLVVVTGTNGDPINQNIKNFREKIAETLLEYGADPTNREVHPMGVHAIIRASVFNHLNILRMMGNKLPKQKLTDALNEIPVVNGLTGLHDTVLRASTVGPDRIEGYLDQMRWYVENGGRWDIEDFSGRTQRDIAEDIREPQLKKKVFNALGIID